MFNFSVATLYLRIIINKIFVEIVCKFALLFFYYYYFYFIIIIFIYYYYFYLLLLFFSQHLETIS